MHLCKLSGMTTNTAPQGEPSQATVDPDPTPAVVETPDEVAALKAQLASLQAKISDEKKADRAAKVRAQEEAEKAGKLAEALDAAKARLAELEPLEPLALRWRSHEETQTKALDAEAASLPEAFKGLYARAGDIEAKAEVLAAYKAAAGAAPAPGKVAGTPPSVGAPAAVSEADIEAAVKAKDGVKLQEIKARDPNAVKAWFARMVNGGRSQAPSLGISKFS
jgi:hypothetical protein